MAFWDNQQLDFGGSDYDPTQSNVLGQSLAPVNPQGQLSAVDADNDTRDPFQLKRDAQQANAVATNSADEDDNYIKSQNGNRYEKVNNSKWDQSLTAAATYMSAYFATGGNVGKAGMAVGQALYDQDAKAHRLGQADKLEAEGMNPLDIQNWINSGDKKDLITNKGSWTSGGNGTMFNTLSGEVRNIPGATNLNAPVKTVDLGDRKVMYYADGRQEEVAKGATPKFSAVNPNGGSIGLDEDENPAFKTDDSGGLLKLSGYNKDGSPRYTAANSKDIETFNGKQTAGTPDANQKLVSEDLNVALNATPDQLNRFTGQLVGRSPTARDVSSSLDPDTRKVYQASERLTTQMGNAAISAAKAAGASGINTEAEIKRFTAGVPQVDYTNEANYKASIQKIQDYADNYKNQLIAGKTGVTPTQGTTAPKGVTHVQRNPQTGKLEIVGG